MRRKTNIECLVTGILVAGTLVSGTILSSIKVNADTNDTVVDEVNVTVPVACTMNGVVNTAHTATLMNGTYSAATGSDYENGIGKTTLTTYCNDYNGFSIYAIGYTGNNEGTNTLIGQSTGQTINTAVYTSGDNTSSWSMKLTKVTDTTSAYLPNNLTITNSFNDYHTVPTEYTKVAEYHASTGSSATDTVLGSKLETTYAAYISQTQVADTYEGKVKYVLVHPSTGDAPVNADQVGVTYNGNGLTFASGGSKNRVIYKSGCTETGEYIGNTPTISKTPNVNNDGTATSGYAYNTTQTDPVTIAGASKLKVELQYGIENNYDYLYVFQGTYSGEVTGGEDAPMEAGQMATYTGGNGSDDAKFTPGETATFYVTGDTVTFAFFGDDYQDDGYYGYYAKVYPVYITEQPDTTADTICSITAETDTYATTTTWKGKWYINSNNETTFLENEAAVINYLEQNSALLGTNVDIYAYNPYTIIYNGNGATAGTMSGFTTSVDTLSGTADLMAPNFKKTGYGFAGWSANQNATVNSSSKIYGPNEKITGNELTYDSSTRETTLYAVWVASAGTMQNWIGCSSLTTGQVTALTDSRDNNVYTVGKLADGNCWMMENLRLDSTNSTDSSLAQGFGGVFTGLATSEDASFGSTTANSLYSTSNITGSYQSYRFPRYNNNNTNIGGTNSANTTLTVHPGSYDGSYYDEDQYNAGNNDHVQWYGYGNYYTWAAAMANTTSYTSYSASEAVSTSICPKGWSLPYGRDSGNGAASGGFSYLDQQLGGTGSFQSDNDGEEIVSNRWRSYPNNFVYSGSWSGSSATDRGSSGRYWSLSANSSSGAYDLYFNSGYVGPGPAYSSKDNGYSARCLAQ